MNIMNWTPLYLDYITHYGDLGNSYRRSTVTVISDEFSTYQLSKWYKGCGFSPDVVYYKSFEEAKKAGEDWYHKGL